MNAPAAGVITEFLVEDGDKVTPGTKLFKLEVGGAAAAAKSADQPRKASEESTKSEASPVAPAPVAPAIDQQQPVPTELPPFPAQIPPLPSMETQDVVIELW